MYKLEMPLRYRRGAVTAHPEEVTKHRGLGGLWTRDIYFSQFWRLDIHNWGASPVESWEGLPLGHSHTACDLSYPLLLGKGRESPLRSLLQGH